MIHGPCIGDVNRSPELYQDCDGLEFMAKRSPTKRCSAKRAAAVNVCIVSVWISEPELVLLLSSPDLENVGVVMGHSDAVFVAMSEIRVLMALRRRNGNVS